MGTLCQWPTSRIGSSSSCRNAPERCRTKRFLISAPQGHNQSTRLQPTQRRDILENRGNMANILGKNCSEDYFGILARSPQRGRRGRAVSIRPEGTRVEVTRRPRCSVTLVEKWNLSLVGSHETKPAKRVPLNGWGGRSQEMNPTTMRPGHEAQMPVDSRPRNRRPDHCSWQAPLGNCIYYKSNSQ